MAPKSMIIATNANSITGAGHLRRLIQVASFFPGEFKRYFYGSVEIPWARDLIKDYAIISNSDKVFGANTFLILDSYDRDFCLETASRFKYAPVFQFVDRNSFLLPNSQLIFMDLPFEYPNKNIQNQTIAHGLNFIPVRLFRSGNSKFQRQAKRVVITTGGVVNQHIFLIFIKELQKRQYENIFFDFIGIPEHHPGNINNFEFHQMGRQFDNLVANCDTVISSAGTTMWDLIANQKPIGLISVAENQESNFAFAVASGAAVRVLDSNNTKPDLDGLNSLFFDEDVRLNLINKERVDLDFLGASRVCELIMRKMRERKAFDTSF